jgi:hypothetical protein
LKSPLRLHPQKPPAIHSEAAKSANEVLLRRGLSKAIKLNNAAEGRH